MQNKLQELTEKIYNEGLSKGTEEANQLVANAKEEANKIISKAKKEAEQIVSDAATKGAELKKNAETEVEISVKQVVTALKQDISKLIETKVIDAPLKDALKDVEFVKTIIQAAMANWSPNTSGQVALNVLVPEAQEKELQEFLSSKVSSTLNQEVEVVADRNLKYGFKIGPQDGSYFIGFSEKDFENLFREYMRPRIVEQLFGEK